MFENIKAAIFDLDGTLIDSMWVWDKIDTDYLSSKNIERPDDLRENIEHLSFYETAIYFKNRFNITDSLEQIMNQWNEMALYEYEFEVKLKPGAAEFLSYLKSQNIKIGLATSNTPTLLQLALKSNGIYHYFDSITTTNEVSKGKDCPDVYLLAAQKLGVHPSECIVFEDILPAVKGAKAAGMKVVGVYDNYSTHQRGEITSIADKYINKYDELISNEEIA